MRLHKLGLGLIVGILCLAPTVGQAGPAEPSRDINTYVLFAYDELIFKGGSAAQDTGHIRGGNIGVNFPGLAQGSFSLSYATRGQAIMEPGSQAVADSVRADNPAGVFGDLFANSVNASFNPTILGMGPTPYATPIIATGDLPVLPFTPNRALTNTASDVTVGGGGLPSPFTFTPGAYRDVRVNDDSTVIFGDGVFDIRSLSLGAQVTVVVTDGTVMQIDQGWSMNNDLKLGVGTNAGARIFVGAHGFNVTTTRVTNFAHRGEIHAQFFAPTGWLDLGGNGSLFGRFWAQRITGDPGNNIMFEGEPNDPQVERHYQCYELHRRPLRQAGVLLSDLFGSSTVTVQKAKRLCAPADKNDEDPSAREDPGHLTFYTIKQTDPRRSRIRNISVTNQFGTLVIDAVRADRMLVPTAKSLAGSPDSLSRRLNHYKCYRTAGARFNASGISIRDQFGSVVLDLKRVSGLCLAAEKNGEPIVDADAHLLCYKTRRSRGTPRPQLPDQVFTQNQFGPDEFELFGPRDFCVPSTVEIP